MNKEQRPAPLGLDDDFLSSFDDADYEELGLAELLAGLPAGEPECRTNRDAGAFRAGLLNAAWTALCLAILTGSSLAAWGILRG